MKKLVVYLDGTWNKPGETGSNTNVVKIYRSILGEDTAGLDAAANRPAPAAPTIKWYDAGVGTESGERFRGGLTGSGLSLNIRQGYKFLVDHFEEGDEIYLFGFSRGAYSARSLAGFIRNVGLVKSELASSQMADDNPVITRGYEIYRQRDAGPDTEEAKEFREANSWHPVPIKLIGVWDTVGALGIPLSIFHRLNDERYGFHDTRLSSSVENAFHALAVDEHRREYEATLWNPAEKFPNHLEQRWFIGAHSDVGGGSRKIQFSDLALRWMIDKARLEGDGLEIDPESVPQLTEDYLSSSISDSFKSMMRGIYAFVMGLIGKGRLYRAVLSTPFGDEVVDESVDRKRQEDGLYRPGNAGLKELPR